MQRPFRIGMTGGIGSGKSTVGEYFRALGVTVLDADELTRELTAPGQPALTEIRNLFGDEAIDSQGQLSRAFLRSRIFTDDQQRRQLETLLHPRVYERLVECSDSLEEPYVVWIVPLLLETGAADRVDRVLVIDCSETLQIERSRARDHQTEAEIRSIMARQLTREARLQQADDVLLNDKDMESIKEEVSELHRRYLLLATGGNGAQESTP